MFAHTYSLYKFVHQVNEFDKKLRSAANDIQDPEVQLKNVQTLETCIRGQLLSKEKEMQKLEKEEQLAKTPVSIHTLFSRFRTCGLRICTILVNKGIALSCFFPRHAHFPVVCQLVQR